MTWLKRTPRSYKWALLIIFLCYMGALGIALLAETQKLWVYTLVAWIVIAGLQNHLQILQHEGAHRHLHSNRKKNDALADLFCSLPFLGSLRQYRYFHMQHHKHLLNPAQDPEIEFYREQGYEFKPRSIATHIKSALLDLTGVHYLQFFVSFQKYLATEGNRNSNLILSNTEKLRARCVYSILILGLILTRGKLFWYWGIPQMTFLFFFLKLQGYAEHLARTDKVETCTLSHKVNLFEKFFIWPLNSNRHLEHHLFPAKHWYELNSQK